MEENKYSFIFENKHLLFLSILNFIIIYISTFTPGYGYFIDEFYYIACANNPAMGYVDHPPLAPIILMIYKSVFGESVFAIRIIPALAASLTVFMTGIITKQLGGNKTAQSIAAFSILTAPVFAVMGGFYSMNAIEPLLCAFALYYVLKMINEDNPKYWIQTGIMFGLLLMNKHTAALLILFLVAPMVFTKHRKLLFTKYFVLCALITFIIFIPNLIWQIKNGFPSVDFYVTNITRKNIPMSFMSYFIFQLFAYNPFVFPVWLAGVIFLLFNKKVSRYRLLTVLFILTFLFYLYGRNSRVDRMSYAFLAVIPAGAIYIENLIGRMKFRKLCFGLYALLMLLFFSTIIPLMLPFLSYENSAKLTKLLGMNTEVERGNNPLIPQLIADRIGWQEKVDMVGRVLESFPAGERNNIIVAAENYGSAGALELLGKKYGIKNAVCGHNNYYYWSKERLAGDIVLQLTFKREYNGLKESFDEVDSTDTFYNNEYCTPHERNLSVFICRKPKFPKEELLERARFFY
jgi:hypothetical protein